MVIATPATISDETAMMKINEKILFFSPMILPPADRKMERGFI
jgi:hypothetical protein